jgi:hypothetical protein
MDSSPLSRCRAGPSQPLKGVDVERGLVRISRLRDLGIGTGVQSRIRNGDLTPGGVEIQRWDIEMNDEKRAMAEKLDGMGGESAIKLLVPGGLLAIVA